jgi:hypothetical protein
MQNMTINSHRVYQSMLSLNDEPFSIAGPDGKPYSNLGMQVVPVLNEETEQFDFKVYSGEFDNQGQCNPTGEISGGLDAIKKAEMKGLLNSSIHGTNLNYLNLPKGSNPPISF